MMKIIEEIRYVIALRAFWLIIAIVFLWNFLELLIFGSTPALDLFFNLVGVATSLTVFFLSKSHTDK